MEENQIINWINSDKKLYDLIIEIESTEKTLAEKAEMAFEKIPALYNIPKMPDDIKDDSSEYDEESDDLNQRSLFEEHALIKYLAEENEDPRGIVLSSAFHLLNDYRVDFFRVAEKEFADKIPENCRIAVKGEGFNGQVVFPQKETESWFDLGCKVMRQIN